MENKTRREPLFYAAVGKRGIGKTYETINLIEKYFRGNPATGFKPRKVLIMDVNNEFKQYKTISPSDVTRFVVHPKIECRRISVLKPDGHPMSLDEISDVSLQALKDFRGGLFVMEDISKYVSDTLKKDIVGTLATSRHIDTDIIAHFQFIGKVGNPKIMSTIDIIRLHKIGDMVDKHRDKFQEHTEILQIAEMIVNKSFDYGTKLSRAAKTEAEADKYFDKYCRVFCYVDFRKDVIRGTFSAEQFKAAITDYIMYNPKPTVERLMLLRDRTTGKPTYKYNTALEACEKELFEKYYGNSDT